MTPLIDATEMYLRTVWELIEENTPALRARLVERLHVSAPAVSETVNRLIDEGYLNLDTKRRITFTEKGRKEAASVMRKHRLAERLLVDVIGIDRAIAHIEACKWEHVISDTVEGKIVDLLENTSTSPYGNPIPDKDYPEVWKDVTNVYQAAQRSGRGIMARISEYLQYNTELMYQLDEISATPGVHVTLVPDDEGVTIATDHGEIQLDIDQAELIWVLMTET